MRLPLAHLFAKSPFRGIEQLMDRVLDAASEVQPMVNHLVEGDQNGVIDRAKLISRLEGVADEVKNEVRSNLPVRILLPVDRRDVLKLVSQIDAIADSAEDVGVLLTLRPMRVPEPMVPLLREFTEKSVATVETSRELVGTFDTLLRSGFGGKAAQQTISVIDRIAEQEHETDKLQDQLAKELFRLEEELSPVAISMWLRILEEIGDMADHAENVGDQFRLFLAN